MQLGTRINIATVLCKKIVKKFVVQKEGLSNMTTSCLVHSILGFYRT